MAIMAVISLSLSFLLIGFSLVFKTAGKLRLSLPLLYLVVAVISTFFTDWTSEHESLVMLGLYILLGLVVLSWFLSLRNTIQRRRQEKFLEKDVAWQIQRAREMGIPLSEVRFTETGDMLDPRTGEPVDWRS